MKMKILAQRDLKTWEEPGPEDVRRIDFIGEHGGGIHEIRYFENPTVLKDAKQVVFTYNRSSTYDLNNLSEGLKDYLPFYLPSGNINEDVYYNTIDVVFYNPEKMEDNRAFIREGSIDDMTKKVEQFVQYFEKNNIELLFDKEENLFLSGQPRAHEYVLLLKLKDLGYREPYTNWDPKWERHGEIEWK